MYVALAVITGVVYPLLVTGASQILFPWKASGSLIRDANDGIIGSMLIGQPFDGPKYFWPRPSATTDFPYNALASGGSQLGPTNDELMAQVSRRLEPYRTSGGYSAVPADLVTASGSGLDPHITLEAALIQIPRIARARNISEDEIRGAVMDRLEGRQLLFMGRPRINVLDINLALDRREEGDHGKQ